MAIKRLCSVEGCGKPHKSRGWCMSHYSMVRRNGAPSPSTRRPESTILLEKVLAEAVPGPCVLWPFHVGNNGYGLLSYKGKQVGAHILMCAKFHGPKPTPQHEAAHECGVRLCFSPHHISWKTRAGNVADMIRHGTIMRGETHYRAKLGDDDVRKIRRLHAEGFSHYPSLAKMFGITRGQVGMIIRRKSWAWLQ